MKAVFLEYDTVSNGDLDISALAAAVGELQLVSSAENDAPERIRDADIVLLNTLSCRAKLMLHAPKLKLLAVAGTGTDNIDLIAAKALGIGVCNVRGYCTASVVQHVWGLILSLTQHVSEYSRLAVDGSWVQGAAHGTAPSHPRTQRPHLRRGRLGRIGQGRGAGGGSLRHAVVIANRRGEKSRASIAWTCTRCSPNRTSCPCIARSMTRRAA
jgi:glycerate dehydrogenase